MKIAFSFALAFVLSLLCFPQISLSFQDLTAPSNAFTYNDTSFSKIDEIYNGDGTFDKTNFEKLLQQTSGISTLTSSNLSALNTKVASANITAKDMKAFATGDKTAGQDIVVRLGGLDWTPTYLSKTKSGDLILTMWLSNNEQDAFQTRTDNAAEGDFYGFVKSPVTNKYGLYSDWSADWYKDKISQGTAAFYPNNMYGTSYIRSVTLNNGGQYAISNTELAKDPGQNPNSVFAPFTMSSDPLSSFIVTPSEVSWQEKQSATATNGAPVLYDCPNDEWNPDTAQGKYYSDAFNYVEHNGYDTWKNDKLWLPSLTETGYHNGSTGLGLWIPSPDQIKNYNASGNDFTATIGTSENKCYATTANTFSWRRSGRSGVDDMVEWASALYPTGYNDNYLYVYESCAVRPALHLNLKKAAITTVTFDDFISANSYPGIRGYSGSYYISDFTGLEAISDFTNAGGTFKSTDHFRLDRDIDCTGKTLKTILSFTGFFEGQGYSIVNLKTSGSPNGDCFIYTAKDAFISNLNLLGYNIDGGTIAATVINTFSGTVLLENIYRTGTTKGGAASGLVGGGSGKLYIRGCMISGTINASSSAAAFVVQIDSNGTVYIENSCFVRATMMENNRRVCRTIYVCTGAVYYSGVYLYCGPSSTYKKYYAGFTDSQWDCNGLLYGYPTLKWNLAIQDHLSNVTSVEERLIELGFTAAT